MVAVAITRTELTAADLRLEPSRNSNGSPPPVDTGSNTTSPAATVRPDR